ncbi:MAG: peptidylprolyl isomerase [Gammaproteobacteria bacterium]|nr:peptidylprolyl isomerase [Gammaproteobacteria bacterium]
MSNQSKLLLISMFLGTVIAIISIIETNNDYINLPDDVIATVNDVIIEREKLDTVINLIGGDKRGGYTDKDQILALERIIEEELLVQYAYKNGFLSADDNIRKTIIRSVIDTIVEQTISIMPEKETLQEFYKSHQEIFATSEQVKIVILNINNLNNANAIKKIWVETNNETLILNTIDNITKSNTPNGYIPIFTLPRLIGPKLAKTIDMLKLNEISLPIETSSGYSLAILKDRKAKQTPSYEEVKEAVLQEYRRRSRDELMSTLLDELKQKAEIRKNKNLY